MKRMMRDFKRSTEKVGLEIHLDRHKFSATKDRTKEWR